MKAHKWPFVSDFTISLWNLHIHVKSSCSVSRVESEFCQQMKRFVLFLVKVVIFMFTIYAIHIILISAQTLNWS